MAAGDNPLYNYKPRSGELGSPTWFQSDSYTIKNLMYPDDLMSSTNNQYGGNYVIFYINVHEDSYLFKGSEAAKNRTVTDIPPNLRGEVSGKFSSADVVVAGGIAGAVPGGASAARATIGASGADVIKKVTGIDSAKIFGLETAANFGTGALVTGAAVTALNGVANKYKRMESAIALHVPTDLSISYSANWSTTDMAGMAAAATVGDSIGNAIEQLTKSGITQSAGELSNAGEAGISYLVSRGLQTQGIGEFVGKVSGTAANPKKEQLFRNVDFRTFSFNYQFFPRSKEEAQKVQAIIKTFKLHMHPEFKDASHFLYTYPSEFDIYYYQNGQENMNIHRHTSCVLTDMNISYTPQSILSTFEDGMPTQINVQLQFKELALLTKEAIADGY